GKPPLELRAPHAVAGDEHHEIGEAPPGLARFPAANAILDVAHGVDDDVEVFIRRPARRADDEADRTRTAHAEPREQRLTQTLALAVLDRHEHGRGPIVEHARGLDAEAIAQGPGQAGRHAHD